jgi:hypothetical protein
LAKAGGLIRSAAARATLAAKLAHPPLLVDGSSPPGAARSAHWRWADGAQEGAATGRAWLGAAVRLPVAWAAVAAGRCAASILAPVAYEIWAAAMGRPGCGEASLAPFDAKRGLIFDVADRNTPNHL